MAKEILHDKNTHHLYVLLATIIMILIFCYTIDVFLLAFAGTLFAIIIRSSSHLIKKYTGLSSKISLTLVLIALVLLLPFVVLMLAPSISEQVSQLYTDLPAAWNKFNNDFVARFIVINDSIAQDANLQKTISKIPNVTSKLGGVFTSTFGFIGDFFIILFFGVSLACQPNIYINGFVNLFPSRKQSQVKSILNNSAKTLKSWLVGKAFSMVIIGLLTWGGLWILGIPLAFTLALLAAILSFIPNIGPIIAAVPAILLALLESPLYALYVVILYLVIQTIESYLITPLVQQKAISLPPALIIFMQLIMFLLVGLLGLALATPLLSVISVVVKQIYLDKQA